MKPNWRKLLAKCKQNNTGSSILIVVVTTMFIATMGASLLYVTHTGYKIKSVQNDSAHTFYQASLMEEEVLFLLQDAARKAFDSAYLEVMQTYTSYNEASAAVNAQNRQAAFEAHYLDALLHTQDASGELLLKSSGSATSWNKLYLTNQLVTTEQNTADERLVLSCGNNTFPVEVPTLHSGDPLIIEDILITYEDHHTERNISIEMDVVFPMPNFAPSDPTEWDDLVTIDNWIRY